MMSVPYVSEGEPGRYGRDFHDPQAGPGRIEEAPPADMDPDANVVSRIIVRFFDRKEDDEQLDTVDTRDVAQFQGGVMPQNLEEFRRLVIHEELMSEIIGKCIYHAMNPNYI